MKEKNPRVGSRMTEGLVYLHKKNCYALKKYLGDEELTKTLGLSALSFLLLSLTLSTMMKMLFTVLYGNLKNEKVEEEKASSRLSI